MGYNFSPEDIRRVLKELADRIRGARIQEVYQPFGEDIYLEIYHPKNTEYLLISVENGFNRIYLTQKRPPNPLNPFSFQMLLRKYLVPSYISEVSQINNDRVVMISNGEFRIYAELTGRHSNIFLTDANDTILGSLRDNISQKRALFVSCRYLPPYNRELTYVNDISVPVDNNISEFYSDYYERLINEHRINTARAKILGRLNNRKRHLLFVLEKIENDKAKASKYNEYLKYAEALKQRRIVEKKSDSVLCEYYAETGLESLNVPLIKGADVDRNMENYFRLYKKYKNSLPLILNRENEIKRELEEVLKKIDSAESLEDLSSLESLCDLNISGKSSAIKPLRESEGGTKYPFRVYFAEGIGKIYSGSDAEENEILTFRYSRGSDLWFHVIGYSGSHTVLPVQRDKIPSEKQILTAALLAAARSSAPDGESVEVAYTRVKYVRKSRGGMKGSVIFSNEKRLLVRVDKKFPSRLILLS